MLNVYVIDMRKLTLQESKEVSEYIQSAAFLFDFKFSENKLTFAIAYIEEADCALFEQELPHPCPIKDVTGYQNLQDLNMETVFDHQ